MFEKGIEFFATKELSLTQRKAELRVSLTAIEAEAGAAALDAEEPGSPEVTASFDRFERARVEVRALSVAIATCRARRVAAIKTARATEVAELRKQAGDKASDLRSLESKTAKLLTQLSELEGCAFVAAGTPKSATLTADVDRLERAARDMEGQDIPTSGEIDLADVTTSEQVLLAAANHPSNGPTIEQVAVWLAACEDSAQELYHSGFGDFPRRVRIQWSDGVIDAMQSYVFCAALAKKLDAEHIDVASGTFCAGVATLPSGRVAQQPAEVQTRGGWYRA